MKTKIHYANWISKKIPITGGILTILLGAGTALSLLLAERTTVLFFVLLVPAILCCAFALYMAAARTALSYHGGNVQSKVLDNVLSYLDTLHWNGTGALLDIGCGSGAMSIKAAKKYPSSTVTGIDYWGPEWDYSKTLCENNARLEGVTDHIHFQKGDAANLDFADAFFDAEISNFVFHEVRNQPDKLTLIREALRVLKPGGAFVFEDIFYAKSHYGEIEDFVKQLKPYVSEIHFVDTRRPDFAPKFLNTPLVLGQMGLIYGKK